MGCEKVWQNSRLIEGNNGVITNCAQTGSAVTAKGIATAVLSSINLVLYSARGLLVLRDEGLKSAGAGCDQQD